MTQAFPLLWPQGWKRTPGNLRRLAPFKVTPSQANQEMLRELALLGAKNLIISTDQPRNRDGSLSAGRRKCDDPGVAVYFKRKLVETVLACDQYTQVHDNIRAIGKTVEALRGIERWGASDMLDRAFTGFTALAAPEQWWQVLGLTATASDDEINTKFRALAKVAHSDAGGSDAAMARLNAARDAGLGR